MGTNCAPLVADLFLFCYERETDSIKFQISSKTSRGKKRTAQKDVIKDISSDNQVNSCFPYRWPPASLTINIYFTYFCINI